MQTGEKLQLISCDNAKDAENVELFFITFMSTQQTFLVTQKIAGTW